MRIPWPFRPVARALATAAAALLCGALTGLGAHAHLAHLASMEAARLSQVTATILEPAAPDRSSPAIGHWTADDGTRRVGVVPAPPDKTAGDSHLVWIDEQGQVSAPPATAGQRAAQTILAASAVASAVIVIVRCHPRCDAVDAEWRRVAGEWRRRYL